MAELVVKNLSFSYGKKKILEDIQLELHGQELVSLLGVSGGGKTTLFHMIAGLSKPDCGSILLDGRDITGKNGQISYMLQKDMLLPHRTIEDNVALPLLLRGESKKRAREEVSSYFPTFGLEGSGKKYPHQLSGGMKQRAAFLRTYLFSKEMILLDEPFSALDTFTKNEMHQWYLKVMTNLSLSSFFITHDIDEAILLSDRIYLLGGKPGRILDEIKVKEPRPRDEKFLLTSEFLAYKKEIIQKLNR